MAEQLIPIVSVVIPNYNHAKYLAQRIESVINQTFVDIEIILMDDCSTDGSRAVIEHYAALDSRIQILYNQVNSGSTFQQWKKGIERSKGEWIWIAESDDWCEPVFLENLLKGVNDECSIAFCQSMIIQDENQLLWNTKTGFLEQKLAGVDFVKAKMLDVNSIVNASMCIFRKKLYYNISQDFAEYKFCGDWLFWIEIALHGDVFISGKVLNYFRKHGSDVSGKSYRNGVFYIEYMKILDSMKKKALISAEQEMNKLIETFKLFLSDKRLKIDMVLPIKRAFYDKFGCNIFAGQYRNKIGTRLLAGALLYNLNKRVR